MRSLLFALFLSLFSALPYASESALNFYKPSFDNITTAQGLSSNLINKIIQDDRGFLWIGTENGLNRFDGYSFLTFRSNDQKKGSVSHNTIHDMLISSAGTLWVTTELGIDQYNASNQSFKNIVTDSPVNALLEWTEDTLLLGTDNGLQQISLSTNKISPFPLSGKNITKTILSLAKDAQNRLWIGTEEGLLLYTPDEGSLRTYQHSGNDENSLIDNTILALLPDSRGNVWVGIDGGLSRIDASLNSIRNFYHEEDGRDDELAGDEVTDLYEDQNGQIWIATTEGLNRFIPESGKLLTYIHDPDTPNSVAHSQLNELFVDKNNILWVGTNGGGLSKLHLNAKKFLHSQHHPQRGDSLGYDSVLSFLEDDQGRIWVGLDDEGFNRYDPQTGMFERFEYEAEKYPTKATEEGIFWIDAGGIHKDRVRAMQADEQGNLWIATSEGLEFFDLNNIRFRHFSPAENRPHSLSHQDINSIVLSDASTLWVATNGGGLNRFNPNTYHNKIYRHDSENANSLSSDKLQHIEQSKDGKLWIATLGGGINIFDPSQDKFTRLSLKLDSEDAAIDSLNDEIWTIYESTDSIWVGTSKGLNRLNPSTLKLEFIPVGKENVHSKVLGIVEDKQGMLWLSKENGLSKFNPKTEEIENFSTRNGLPTDQFLPGAYFISSAGDIYLGSNQGMIHFKPEDIQTNQSIPKLVFTKLDVLNREITPHNSFLLDKVITETSHLNLSHRDKTFSLSFSALDYANPANNQYAYKLEGFDNGWNLIGNNRIANFTSLPDGHYTLKVRGSNSDYIWNEEGIALDITVNPPFWKTWWAYVGYVLLLALSIFIIIKVRARRYEIKIAEQEAAKNLLEKKVAERTEALYDKSQELEKSNKNIISSIEYAQRIQQSLLPNHKTVQNIFKDLFIFWQPRDIVGGDVYYIDQINDKMVVSVVDCTGHGVPGAFMTMLASSGLRRITKDEGCLDPAEILSRLNRVVQQSLQQDTDQAASDDGLDAAICVIDPATRELVFAGANLPLSYIDQGEVITIKGDRQSLGYKRTPSDYAFTNHTLAIQESAIYYLYTDGILDQLGGDKRRMFGTRRFKESLLKSHALPSEEHKDNIIVDLEDYRANNEVQDDRTLIGFRM